MNPKIQSLLDQRAKARSEKNWALTDSLRKQLNAWGVDVRDTATGQEIDEWRLPINPLLGEPFKVGDAVFVYHADMVKLAGPFTTEMYLPVDNPVPAPKYWYLGEAKILEINKKEIIIEGAGYLHGRETASYDLNGIYRIRPFFYPFTDMMGTMTKEELEKKNELDAKEEAKSGAYFFLSLKKEIPEWQLEKQQQKESIKPLTWKDKIGPAYSQWKMAVLFKYTWRLQVAFVEFKYWLRRKLNKGRPFYIGNVLIF